MGQILSFRKIHCCFHSGELRVENFGTYIDRFGVINFDVNEFLIYRHATRADWSWVIVNSKINVAKRLNCVRQ
ncbi:unnamed protein product [Rotaria magnacalcarata]